MSDTKNNGGPAFPVPMTMDREGNFHHSAEHPDGIGGMSLRDFFAAKAMAAMIASGGEETHNPAIHPPVEQWMENGFARDAATAYRIADAMLRAREQ